MLDPKYNETNVDLGIIPNMCSLSGVLAVTLLSILLSIFITVLNIQHMSSFWFLLATSSTFILWVAIASTATLCSLRLRLNQYSSLTIIIACLFIVLSLTLVSSLLSIKFFYQQPINLDLHLQQLFLLKSVLSSGLITLIVLRYFFLRRQVIQGIISESSAKFEALQARIQPHFLFNTLNTIASLVTIDAEKAEMTIESLAALMRNSLNRQTKSTLNNECTMCKHYITIEKMRMGDKLEVAWDVDEQLLNIPIPPFLIQPLVENAVYHGIQGLSEGGEVKLTVKQSEENILITVSNPKPTHSSPPGNRVAITNITQRLRILYGEQASLKVNETPNNYCVILSIPKEVDFEHINH